MEIRISGGRSGDGWADAGAANANSAISARTMILTI
jgi:hypothetical protein